jgi:hypothetical protein
MHHATATRTTALVDCVEMHWNLILRVARSLRKLGELACPDVCRLCGVFAAVKKFLEIFGEITWPWVSTLMHLLRVPSAEGNRKNLL